VPLGRVEIRLIRFTPGSKDEELDMPKWTEHLDRILSVLTVILAAGELEHMVAPWVVLLAAILTAISEYLKPTVTLPVIPTGTPPSSEPKPKAGK
jgi:hypothetical protein